MPCLFIFVVLINVEVSQMLGAFLSCESKMEQYLRLMGLNSVLAQYFVMIILQLIFIPEFVYRSVMAFPPIAYIHAHKQVNVIVLFHKLFKVLDDVSE